jgi:hypothetical protein
LTKIKVEASEIAAQQQALTERQSKLHNEAARLTDQRKALASA